jgi:hypothetical protein
MAKAYRQVLCFIWLMIFCGVLSAQPPVQDSCNIKISLLTCGPGQDLYALFGHSALRVKDNNNRFDVIFNYGTFDFNDPNFYTKFVRGKLLYFVSTENYNDFRAAYQYENRSIIEQQLSLSCEQRAGLFRALQVNLEEANRFYLYDFLFDNCSTRLRDIVARNADDTVSFKNIVGSNPPSFRQMIHEYLVKGGQFWSRLGIDILLGSKIDRPVRNEEAMFLPDYLMKGFDSAVVSNRPLVLSKQTVLSGNDTSSNSGKWFRPIIATVLLLIAISSLQFIRSRSAALALKIIDRILFFILGALGLLILFMWFGTDHVVCSNNYNLLWALPTHLPMAFLINHHRKWVMNYFGVMAVWYFILFFAWAMLPQDMNSAIVPIVVLTFIRSLDRYRKIKQHVQRRNV